MLVMVLNVKSFIPLAVEQKRDTLSHFLLLHVTINHGTVPSHIPNNENTQKFSYNFHPT